MYYCLASRHRWYSRRRLDRAWAFCWATNENWKRVGSSYFLEQSFWKR